MKLLLITYAGAAIVVPALWIGVRLWLRRHSRTPVPGFVTAQIIAFPIAMVEANRRRARPLWETNGQRLTRRQRWACRKPTSTSRRDDDPYLRNSLGDAYGRRSPNRECLRPDHPGFAVLDL
jgi:hypothetical protein